MMFRTSQMKVESILPYQMMQSQHVQKKIAKYNNSSYKHKICPIDERYIYAHVTGLHGDQECSELHIARGNLNGDFFQWKGTLLEQRPNNRLAYQSWKNGQVLENHNEDDIYGYIPDVWPIMRKKSVEMLMATDRQEAPHIVKALEDGSLADVSMGTYVGYSFCSNPKCHRHASKGNPNITEDDWCKCLRHLKGSYDHTFGGYIYEDNRDIEGLECSWITEGVGADSDAKLKLTIASLNDDTQMMMNRITEAQKSHRDNVMNLSVTELWNDLSLAKRWI